MKTKLTRSLHLICALTFIFSSSSAYSQPKFKTDFSLQASHGKPVSLADFRGKHVLVFFGFTHCPSVCPLALSTMSKVLRSLGSEASKTQMIFISVDPERDTAKRLTEYLPKFHKDILGLRGTEHEITAVIKGYRAYSQKAPSTNTKNYLIDHSDLIYLLDTQGNYVDHFQSSQGADFITQKIRKAIDP